MEKNKTTNLLRKEILKKIEKTLKDFSSNDQSLSDISESRRSAEVLRQLRDVGWSNVVDCDETFSRVTFSYSSSDVSRVSNDVPSTSKDVYDNGEILLLKVTIPQHFPVEGPVCEDDFPESFSLPKYIWVSGKSNLAQIYSTFVDRVNSLVPVNILIKLSNCWKWLRQFNAIFNYDLVLDNP
jgi:hypothetical protein